MADAGHEATDKLLKRLEKDVAREYKTATKEMQKKLEDYLEKTEAQRKVQEELYKAGQITKKEYSDWCYRHTMIGKRWEEMRDTLAADMHQTNEIAKGIMKERMPDVYAVNANYATYEIESGGGIDTGFTLYNHDTAEYLLGDQRQLMPKPSARKAAQIAANKDMQWNMQKIQSAVLQGVLQGESPYKVAERLRSVGQMNYNSSVRYARTMTTSAQNAGRYEAYRRAKKLGVDLVIEWQATLDGRTRHDHRLMHGQRTEVDKPFHTPDGFEIYYPADCTGDSDAPQKEIWNCRCTLLSWVKGFEGDTVKTSPKMEGMSFEEWQNAKESKVQGEEDIKDILNASKIKNSKKALMEVEQYASEKGLRLVNVDSFSGDIGLLKEQIDVIAEKQAEYNIGKKLKIELSDRISGNALGAINPQGDVIRILSPALRDRNITNKYLQGDNVLAASDVKGIGLHEIGHAIAKTYGEKGLVFAKKAYYNVFNSNISDAEMITYLAQNVSLYAASPKENLLNKSGRAAYREIIPEVLSKDGTNPSQFTREFVKVMKGAFLT